MATPLGSSKDGSSKTGKSGVRKKRKKAQAPRQEWPQDRGPGPEPERGWFGGRSARIWTVVAGIVGTLALVVAVIQLIPRSSEPELEIARLAVQEPGSVDADIIEAGSEAPRKARVNTNVIDITLRNTGDQPALITSVEADVVFAEQMQDCMPTGGGVKASAAYTLKIPATPPRRPFHVSRPVSFEVPARDIDRFTITAGPDEQFMSIPSAWLYVIDLFVQEEGAVKPLPVGTAAFVASAGQGARIAAQDTSDWECIEHNAGLVDKMYAMPAVRSAELDGIKARYASLLQGSAAGTPAEEVCATAATSWASSGIHSACFRYTRRQLVARFELTADAKPEVTQILVRLDPTPVGPTLRWVTRFQGTEWSVGFPEEEAPDTIQWAGEGCGPCTSEGGAKSFTITYATPPSMTATRYAVLIELQDATVPEKPVILATLPVGSVARGV